jgi:hypothetical protein
MRAADLIFSISSVTVLRTASSSSRAAFSYAANLENFFTQQIFEIFSSSELQDRRCQR